MIVLGRTATGETVAARLDELPSVEKHRAHGMSLGEVWFNVGENELLGDRLK